MTDKIQVVDADEELTREYMRIKEKFEKQYNKPLGPALFGARIYLMRELSSARFYLWLSLFCNAILLEVVWRMM